MTTSAIYASEGKSASNRKQTARIAGLLYLIVVITGIVSLAYVPSHINMQNAIKQLRKSPMDLDVYAWLVHRLYHLNARSPGRNSPDSLVTATPNRASSGTFFWTR